MTTLATFLMSMIGPMAVRAIAALGFSVVSFTAVTVTLNALITAAQTNWSGLPPAVLALASLAGIPQAAGIICGAYSAKIGLWVAANGTRWMTAKTVT